MKQQRSLLSPEGGTLAHSAATSAFELQRAVGGSIAAEAVRETLIGAADAAAILDCSAPTLKRMAARGEIPALQIGNRWKFRVSELDEWISNQLRSNYHPCSPRRKEQ